MDAIYRTGYAYAKAGILLMELRQCGELTTELVTPMQSESSERVRGDAMVMGRQIISLERHNLDELKVVEQLAATIGAEAFGVAVVNLAKLHIVDPEATIQSIARLVHPRLIGMSDGPFQVLQKVSDSLVEREPSLLDRPSYLCRDDRITALPWNLWLALVRHARAFFASAGLDAQFLPKS